MFEFLGDLWGFMRENKKFWLLPIFFILAILGFFLLVAHSAPYAAFLYPFF